MDHSLGFVKDLSLWRRLRWIDIHDREAWGTYGVLEIPFILRNTFCDELSYFPLLVLGLFTIEDMFFY